MPAAGTHQILAFFFRPAGRISRREYGLGILFILFVSYAFLALLLPRIPLRTDLVLLIAFLGSPLTVAILVLVAKRCHDLGLPGSFVLLLAVPFAGPVWLVLLALLPGNARPNLYGAEPRFAPD
jgi:uncharacterized membrane protein YhaH (DUF805 family)